MRWTMVVVLGWTAMTLPAQEQRVWQLQAQIPATDDYVQMQALVRTVDQMPVYSKADVRPAEYLLENHRAAALLLYVRANLELRAPEVRYSVGGIYSNPVVLAYRAGQFDLMKQILALDPSLLEFNRSSDESSDPVPLAVAVAANDLTGAAWFMSQGADVKTESVVHLKGDGPEYPLNLLTISPSPEMDKILLLAKVPTVAVASPPWKSHCTDDHVRLRQDPSTTAPILAQLNKGDPLQVLGSTYKRTTIGDQTGVWVKVQVKALVGWVFEPFVFYEY